MDSIIFFLYRCEKDEYIQFRFLFANKDVLEESCRLTCWNTSFRIYCIKYNLLKKLYLHLSCFTFQRLIDLRFITCNRSVWSSTYLRKKIAQLITSLPIELTVSALLPPDIQLVKTCIATSIDTNVLQLRMPFECTYFRFQQIPHILQPHIALSHTRLPIDIGSKIPVLESIVSFSNRVWHYINLGKPILPTFIILSMPVDGVQQHKHTNR